MVNKLLLFILFTFISVNIISAQSANFWITNPSIKGKLTLQHGWVLSDTAAGGIKFTGDVWIGGSQLFLGGSQIKDSTGFIIFSKGIKTRPPSGGTAIEPWIHGGMLADTTIPPSKIKKGSITTSEIAPGLRDSIFSTSTTNGVLNTNINTVKNRVDKLFDAKGNFKSTVFGNTLSYDTATAKVSIDTNYYLKARDSTRYLAGGIDTSLFLMHNDTLRFTSSTAFLPRSDTVKFLKFTDTTNFIKKSDSSRYWTKTALDSSTLLRKNRTDLFWSTSTYNPAIYYNTGNLDTSNLAKKSDLMGDIDSTLWWSRTSYNPANFWQWKNKDTNRYYSVRNLDTSKIWTTSKYPVASIWNTTTYNPNNYWTYSNKDTNNYWTKQRLDTNNYWNKNKYPPSTFYANTNVNGSIFLDTSSLLKRNQTDVYWSRYDNETGAGWLDSAKLTKKADSTYWRKTNLDTSRFLSRTDIDPAVFTYNGSQITVNNFQMDPKKIDSSKIGKGLKYNSVTQKLELARTDTLFTGVAANGKDIIPKFTATFSWQTIFTPTALGEDHYLTRAPDVDFTYEDNKGYGMPFAGTIYFMSMDDQISLTRSLNPNITFEKEDLISVQYKSTELPSGFIIYKNDAQVGTILVDPASDRIVTFTIGVIYNNE